LPALEWLHLDQTAPLSDESLGSISRMPMLGHLWLGGKFTDRGLEYLAQSHTLRDVRIVSGNLSPEAVEALGKKMVVNVVRRGPPIPAPRK
jgi:hypothetical protein